MVFLIWVRIHIYFKAVCLVSVRHLLVSVFFSLYPSSSPLPIPLPSRSPLFFFYNYLPFLFFFKSGLQSKQRASNWSERPAWGACLPRRGGRFPIHVTSLGTAQMTAPVKVLSSTGKATSVIGPTLPWLLWKCHEIYELGNPAWTMATLLCDWTFLGSNALAFPFILEIPF